MWIVVLCLLLSPVPTFSAAGAEVKIPVSVVWKGAKITGNRETQFFLQGEGEAPVPADNSVKISGTGKATFQGIYFASPGIYDYILFQGSTEARNGIRYDKTRYYIRITVVNGEKGDLEASVAAYTDSRREGRKSEIRFVNTYEAGVTVTPVPTHGRKNSETSSKTVVKSTVRSVQTSTKPRTGDATPLIRWIVILGAAGICIVILYIALIRKHNKKG